MVKLLLIASVVAMTKADMNEEPTSPTHISPEYLKPRESYHKPPLFYPLGEHEIGRYHNNFYGYYTEGYGLHHEGIPGHSDHPNLDPKIISMYKHGQPIVHKQINYPLHHGPYFKYRGYRPTFDYVPSKEAYHNVSPYVERKIDYYAYDHGYGNGYGYGHN